GDGDGGGDGDGDGDGETTSDLLPGVGIFLGTIPGGNITVTYGTETLGDSVRLTPTATFTDVGDLDLQDRIFHPSGSMAHGDSSMGGDLFPFVLYRHQVSTQRFPTAVPNLLQVSPLIERINTTPSGANSFILRDPYIVPVSFGEVAVPMTGLFDINDPQEIELGLDFISEVPLNDRPAYLGNSENGLYWVDHMPVIEGAAYRYLIVQFADNGEIRRIIPTNTVEF
ncbi:MAG: hypothetical protein JJT75_12395, partial [Opitutales bacterium]|nr:hypothetical protein [Opitutales bacterium]